MEKFSKKKYFITFAAELVNYINEYEQYYDKAYYTQIFNKRR